MSYRVRITENTFVSGQPVTKGDVIEVSPADFVALRNARRCTIAEAYREPDPPSAPDSQPEKSPNSKRK